MRPVRERDVRTVHRDRCRRPRVIHEAIQIARHCLVARPAWDPDVHREPMRLDGRHRQLHRAVPRIAGLLRDLHRSGGRLDVEDVDGGKWTFDFEVTAPPYVIVPVGYHLGSWRDGGNIHTYHGPDDPYMEWDEFDFSRQPTPHTLYGETAPRTVYGVEHYGWVQVTDPQGSRHRGLQHTEVFLNGRYAPYGLEAPQVSGHGLVGRGIL